MRLKVLSALTNIANQLDKLGFNNEARDIDNLIKNAADVLQFPSKGPIPPQPEQDIALPEMDIWTEKPNKDIVESDSGWYTSKTYNPDKAIDDAIKKGEQFEAYKKIIKFKPKTPLHEIQRVLYDQVAEAAKMLIWLDDETTIDLLNMLPHRGNPWAYWTKMSDYWTLEIGYLEMDAPRAG